MSWPLLPVPITSARLPFQSSPSRYWLECSTCPAKSFSVGISGKFGMPLTPVAITTCRGCMRRAVPSARRSVDGPALSRLVVRAALEFRAGPVVELHRLHIGLEPVGELVLRDVGRPVRRKRHVGQVIDLHLVVQRQRVVALAPVVADALLAVDDQRVDAELRQARARSTARPVRRRPPAPPGRDRHSAAADLRWSSQLGPRKSRE